MFSKADECGLGISGYEGEYTGNCSEDGWILVGAGTGLGEEGRAEIARNWGDSRKAWRRNEGWCSDLLATTLR